MTTRFIIHNGSYASLYCRVLERHEQAVTGFVINGAWDFVITPRTGEMTFASRMGVHHMKGNQIMWLPYDRGDRHYNEVLEWAKKRLKLHPAHRWLLERGDAIEYHAHEFRKKWRRASSAFLDAWRGKRRAFNDTDVPF